MGALRRLVVDPDLAETDPARQTLEEPVALGQLLEGGGGARGEQAEIARVLRNLLPRSPIDQQIEGFDRKAEKPRLVLAIGLCGEDDIVALIEPMADQRLDQGRRMLAVAVHEQDGAETGMIEAGRERRFLAEV